MELVFRADCSKQIGVGHVMRICAIAEQAIRLGISCYFVGDIGEISWVKQYVQSLGFIRISPSEDIHGYSNQNCILILDTYSSHAVEVAVTDNRWKKIIRIFDSETPFYDAELHIHPGFEDLEIQNSHISVCSGPQYISFRSDIQPAPKFRDMAKQILVFAGGTDPYGFAEQITLCLETISIFDSAIVLRSKPFSKSMNDQRITFKRFGIGIDELISQSDLVLTTASTSCLEVAVRGIPVGVASVTKNQNPFYDKIDEIPFAGKIGRRHDDGKWEINRDEIIRLLADIDYRKQLRRTATTLLDFEGSKRVVNAIISYPTSSQRD